MFKFILLSVRLAKNEGLKMVTFDAARYWKYLNHLKALLQEVKV